LRSEKTPVSLAKTRKMNSEKDKLIVLKETDFRQIVKFCTLEWDYLRKIKTMDGYTLFINGYQAHEAELEGLKFTNPYKQFLKENGYIKENNPDA
jgi:hypothetical protein